MKGIDVVIFVEGIQSIRLMMHKSVGFVYFYTIISYNKKKSLTLGRLMKVLYILFIQVTEPKIGR